MLSEALPYSPVHKPLAKKKRVKSAVVKNRRFKSNLRLQIKQSNKERFSISSFDKGIRQYTNSEKFMMKTIYEIFQFIGETEIHIE